MVRLINLSLLAIACSMSGCDPQSPSPRDDQRSPAHDTAGADQTFADAGAQKGLAKWTEQGWTAFRLDNATGALSPFDDAGMTVINEGPPSAPGDPMKFSFHHRDRTYRGEVQAKSNVYWRPVLVIKATSESEMSEPFVVLLRKPADDA